MYDQFKIAWGAEFRTLGLVASIRLRKSPWCTSRGVVGCRIQDLGIRGYRWWKTADFSHSAGTTRTQRTVRPLCHSVVGCLTPTVAGACRWAEWLHQPCLLAGPHMGTKLDLATYLPGVPNRRRRNQKWLHHPCLLRGPKKGRIGYITPAFSGVPNKRGQNQKWLHNPCLLGGPQ